MNNDVGDILKGKVVIVGIGNILRGDDGIGPALIERLQGTVKAVCIDAGTVPESYTGKITKEQPDTILFIDALHLDRSAGEYAVLGKDDIVKSGFTTHDISPAMVIEYLECQTHADIYLLGIQPQNLSLGDEISEPVKKTLTHVEQLLKEVLNA
ncbi:MAG: hydrogenase 3 maturation endopeptidase HyCI [Candidatus Omnitrophica bacterium]|nr:hydrogenase 3 maturation endopeptidase HyCI [Candidatus Omnitrophota bacterium]